MYARRLRRGFGAGNRLIRNNEQSRSQDYGVRFGRNQLRSREFASSSIRYVGISRFCGLRFGGLRGRDCYCALSELRFTKDAIFSNRIGSDGGIRIRDYSSEGDGRNASEGKQAPSGKIGEGREESSSGMESWGEKESFFAKNSNEHRLLNERDHKEWLNKEKASRESKKKEIFLSRKQRYKKEFEKGLHKWEKISISLDNFPYPIRKDTKDALVECASAHLKHQKFCGNYGSRLKSSNERILLESSPGMELYRERVVKALARDLQTSLLIVDSSFLASHDAESEVDAESEDAHECASDSEMEDESDGNEEDWDSSSDAKSDGSDDENHTGVQASVEAIQKLIPNAADEFVKKEGAEAGDSSSSTKSEAEPSQQPERPLRKGDRVKYVAGRATESPVNTRISLGKVASSYGTIDVHTFITSRQLSNGERGEVFEVNGDQASVIMDNDNSLNNEVNDVKSNKDYSESTLCFVNVKELQHDEDAQAEDWYIALNALFELLPVVQPVIIYFPDSEQWLARVVPKSSRRSFLAKAEDILSKLSGPLVVICGRNKFEPGQKEKDKPRMVFPQLRIDRLPLSLKHLAEGLKGSKKSKPADVDRIFSNVISLQPPKDDELLRKFYKQIEEDKKIISSRSNIRRIHDVLEENDLLCSEVEDVTAENVVLTKQKAEKVVGWARNHYLSGCSLPSVKDEKLLIPSQSLDVAISRLKEQESVLKKPLHSLKNLAADQFESSYLSAVVAADEIGVRFDDIGALEDVKQTLNELVTLPMRRPELFLHGNLLRPVKGVLLFGPPGTGKTMLAKALATEAGANFLSITGSSVTSKWFGEAEKLAKALFSFASKITPVIIFIDEVDGLLGARGGSFEHEATRRMRNEFMAAWDGLRSRESQRIMVLGATNRPFDLDDAVIRRLPRRIYVDLPDAINRAKILKILLAGENLDVNFKYEDLAHATEGYSGSDLKNLCISAAYRPVQELLEEEKKVGQSKKAPVLRSLNLEDFVQAKSKVSVSVAYDASSMNELRKWNEQYGEGGSRSKKPFGFGVA